MSESRREFLQGTALTAAVGVAAFTPRVASADPSREVCLRLVQLWSDPWRAGGVLIHHPLVWHAATANRSGRWRRACLLAVADATVPPRQGEWDPARNPVLPGAPVG